MQVDTVHHRIIYSTHEGTTHIYRPGLPSTTTLQWFSEYRNQVKMWTSRDGGLTFQRVSFTGTGFATDPTKNTGFSDPDLTMDEGGRIYNTGINLANDALFSSPDGGDTWDRGTPQCHDGDRPWLAGGKKDEVFLATNTNIGGHEVFWSTDGGNTCPPTGIKADGGNGKIYYDHVSGRLVEPAQQGGTLGVNVWSRGDSEFTFMPGIEGQSMYAHWPAIALDGTGTIYMVWDTDPRAEGTSGGCGGDPTPVPNQVNMAYSKDFGKTWSNIINIASPAGRRAFWPWVFAGDKGKVSVVWYQTERVVDLACEVAELTIHAASVINADDDAKRSLQTVDAGGRVISIGDICQSGTTCVATGEDRRLGDFFTNAIDERGCAIIGSGDTMKTAPGSDSQQRATSLPIFIRQISGPRLIGSGDCSGLPDPPVGTPLPVTPGPTIVTSPVTKKGKCVSRRNFGIRLKAPKGQQLARATVYVNGKRARVLRGKRLRARVKLTGLPKGRFTVKVVAFTGQGRRIVSVRKYRTCTPKKRS